ncbi:MAG: hypothetical protein H0U21_08300 [Acidimicrobiia bacterium]|nr:hypothetical protein [Acidimicrobiia bacterium]
MKCTRQRCHEAPTMGDGGPWHRLLGHEHQSPTEIAAEALQHAAEAALEQRVRLLLARGMDPNAPGTHPGYAGRGPYEGAVLHGNLAIAGLLAEAGADPTAVVPTARFIGACLAADTSAPNSALASDPGLLARVMQDRTDLVARAAMLGRPDAIRLLVRLGFDLNARRRCTRRTSGNLAIVTLLIELGADPTIVDTEHNSTPKGWARHGGHQRVVDYLDRLDSQT